MATSVCAPCVTGGLSATVTGRGSARGATKRGNAVRFDPSERCSAWRRGRQCAKKVVKGGFCNACYVREWKKRKNEKQETEVATEGAAG